jgi:uncharacterized protein
MKISPHSVRRNDRNKKVQLGEGFLACARNDNARMATIIGVSMPYNEEEAHELAESMNMAVYHVFLLKKGPTWSPEPTPEIDALQEAHLANLRRLAEMGKLVLNGPLLDSFALSGEIRGIGVLKTDTLREAQELVATDPMVKVGRLVFELHAWMVEKDVLP